MLPFQKYSIYYDPIYKNKDYEAETEFINKVIEKYSKGRVKSILSLGCGTCSHDILLAKKGYSITGIDISTEMLKIAKDKIKKAGLLDQIKLYKKDIRSFLLPSVYDFAMAMFNVVGYQTESGDAEKMLNNVNKALKKGALLVFDCWYLPAVLKDRPTNRVKKIKLGGREIVRTTHSKLDIARKMIEVKFNVKEMKKGEIVNETEEVHNMRFWTLPELEYLLESAGFKLVKACNFLDLDTDVSEDKWDIFVIARKK